jgi:Domain of unknown function (DUF4160)
LFCSIHTLPLRAEESFRYRSIGLELEQILPYVFEGVLAGRRMPEIKRFGSFKILMFFQDENPPHVHIKGTDFAAKIRISNGDLLAGKAPSKALDRARQWIEENRADLSAMWDEFQR